MKKEILEHSSRHIFDDSGDSFLHEKSTLMIGKMK
jgi:hypothetical protein